MVNCPVLSFVSAFLRRGQHSIQFIALRCQQEGGLSLCPPTTPPAALDGLTSATYLTSGWT